MKFLRAVPFYKRNQKLGESIDAYFSELKQIARKCDFQDGDRMVRDRLVIGIGDHQTRKTQLEKKKLSLGEALDICRAQEQATTHAKEMNSTKTGLIGCNLDLERKPLKQIIKYSLDLQLLQHAVQYAAEYTWQENVQENLLLAIIAIGGDILQNFVETSLKKQKLTHWI